MRSVISSILLCCLCWALFLQFLPVELSQNGLAFGIDDALFAVALLSIVALAESLWSWVRARRFAQRDAEYARAVEVAAGIRKELSAAMQERDVARGELVKLSERVREAEGREVAVKKKLEDDIAKLRQALTRAESARIAAVNRQSAPGREVLHFLSRLQEKGRFIDFLMEDVGGYTDQQIGAAARFVHDGCRSVVREYLDVRPIQEGNEGASITVSSVEQASGLRFIGKAAIRYPVTGRLVHRGWKVTRASFPEISTVTEGPQAGAVLAPAEIELQ